MEELIVNEFNERWVKVEDEVFCNSVKSKIDDTLSLRYVAIIPSPDEKPRWVIELHGGNNGNGEWNEYLICVVSTINKLKLIFNTVTILDIKNDVPDDVFDMRIIVS